MNISKCFLTNSEIHDSSVHGKIMVSPNSGRNLLFIYFIDFYGERRKIRVCHDLSRRLVTKDNEILSISDIDNDNIRCYLLHFLFEVSKEQFEPLFANRLHFECSTAEDEENLSVVSFIDNLHPELLDIPNSERKMNMLLEAIYDEREGTDDLSEISFVNDFKFRAKSYMIDSNELNSYLEDLEEDKLIKISGKYVRLTLKGLNYIKNNFRHMKENNNPIINNGNMTINSGNGNTSYQTQSIGNTFSQENKSDIKEIIQFLKENKEELNLPNHTTTDIQILEEEVSNESPNIGRLNFALDSIKNGLVSIGANLVTPKVKVGLDMVLIKINELLSAVPIG